MRLRLLLDSKDMSSVLAEGQALAGVIAMPSVAITGLASSVVNVPGSMSQTAIMVAKIIKAIASSMCISAVQAASIIWFVTNASSHVHRWEASLVNLNGRSIENAGE